MAPFTYRLATEADLTAIGGLMERAIAGLLPAFLSPDQVATSRRRMGLDRRLIEDRTYFLVEIDGHIAGCGGWSRRATLHGGDTVAALRDDRLLDPGHEPARVRAMYTDPCFIRRGVGRMILALAESAARADGFSTTTLMATPAGEPLYRACGYQVIDRVIETTGGVPVPLARMGRRLVGGDGLEPPTLSV